MDTMVVNTLAPGSASGRRRWLQASIRFARQRPLGAVGAAIIGIMIAAALLAGFVAPYDPLVTDYATMLQAPSSRHWFGTDSYGRDVFTRIIYGSRTALWIGFVSSFLGATLGGIINFISADFSNKTIIMAKMINEKDKSRSMIILALVIVSLLGSGM